MIVIPFQDEVSVTLSDEIVIISQSTQMDGDCNVYVSLHNIPLLIKFLNNIYLEKDVKNED